MSTSKRALGRGLGALLGSAAAPSHDESSIQSISLQLIVPNPFQPRKSFSEESISELARSIYEGQLLQPIALRRVGESFQIVNGERRFRAFQHLNKSAIPAIVLELSDREMLLSALVENIQREDLNAIDEATSYHSLHSEFGLTHEEISQGVGKSRSHVSNSLRLLKLPESVRNFVISGLLSPGAARALLPLDDQTKIMKIASESIVQGWNVRQLETRVREEISNPETRQKTSSTIPGVPPPEFLSRVRALFPQPHELRCIKRVMSLS